METGEPAPFEGKWPPLGDFNATFGEGLVLVLGNLSWILKVLLKTHSSLKTFSTLLFLINYEPSFIYNPSAAAFMGQKMNDLPNYPHYRLRACLWPFLSKWLLCWVSAVVLDLESLCSLWIQLRTISLTHPRSQINFGRELASFCNTMSIFSKRLFISQQWTGGLRLTQSSLGIQRLWYASHRCCYLGAQLSHPAGSHREGLPFTWLRAESNRAFVPKGKSLWKNNYLLLAWLDTRI